MIAMENYVKKAHTHTKCVEFCELRVTRLRVVLKEIHERWCPYIWLVVAKSAVNLAAGP